MGWSSGSSLRNSGLLNIDAPDLGDLMSPPVRRVPFCKSYTCTRYLNSKGEWQTYTKVRRHVTQDDCCEYCHFALVWEKG